MPLNTIPRPAQTEYAPYFDRYIGLVTGSDALAALQADIEETAAALERLPETAGAYRYAPGKWSVREAVGHMIDTERIFAYRALRFSRGDQSSLPGFEQDQFNDAGPYEHCALSDLVSEFTAVRGTTLRLYRNMLPEVLDRSGLADGKAMTARATAWIIAGHELHHMSILRERYLPGLVARS